MPFAKAKLLTLGMTIDLNEHFCHIKENIETTFEVPSLINITELDNIIETTEDESLHVTGLIADDNGMITIYTDNPTVPPLRLPENGLIPIILDDDDDE